MLTQASLPWPWGNAYAVGRTCLTKSVSASGFDRYPFDSEYLYSTYFTRIVHYISAVHGQRYLCKHL